MTDPRLIRLAAPDNVLMIATTLNRGEKLQVSGETVTLAAAL